MRFFIISLLVSWTIATTAHSASIAGPLFTSPFARHGVASPRIGPYLPAHDKKVVPPYWRRGHLIFPCTVPCRHSEHTRKKSTSPKRTVSRQPITLNPDIFSPEPKTPLTLVIEDGVVVETYLGY